MNKNFFQKNFVSSASAKRVQKNTEQNVKNITTPRKNNRNLLSPLLHTIGILMLLSGLGSPFISPTVFSQTNDSSVQEQENCEGGTTYAESNACLPFSVSRIFQKLNPTKKDFSFSSIFATDNPETIGQDLYLAIYDQTIQRPEADAAKSIAGKYAVTEVEATKLIQGNITPILERKPGLTQEEAMAKVSEVQTQFEEEKRMLALQAEINAAVQPTEMFANGDLSDSGFDLIEDLRLIEDLLFLESEPVSVGGTYAGDEEATGTATGASNANTSSNQVSGTTSETQNQNSGTGGTSSQNQNASADPNSTQNQAENQSEQVLESLPFNPNTCFAPTNLDEALKDFETNKLQDKKFKDTAAVPSQSSNSNQSNSKDQQEKQTTKDKSQSHNGNQLQNEDPLPSNPPETQPVQPAPAGTWLQNPPCTEIFCLSINFVKETASSYQLTDNCIACHLEKIVASLKEVVKHDLTPGKVTGNLLEPGICKKAALNSLFDLGLNFYAFAQPVSTPTNDDIIYGASIFDEWNSFVSTYKPFPFDVDAATKQAQQPFSSTSSTSQPVEIPSDLERAVKVALTQSGPDTTYEDITKAINEEITTRSIDRETATKIAEVAVKSDVENGFYNGIIREIDQMNYYFDYFQNVLHSLHEQIDGFSGRQACTDLKNKKQCQ